MAELAHAVLLSCSDYEVLRLLLLENEPHALHVVLCITPVAERIQISQVQLVLLALSDACSGQRDFSCYESLTSALGLVVEEDTRTAVHVVCLAVFLHDPETVLLCDSIRAVWMERSVLVLRHFLHLSVEL